MPLSEETRERLRAGAIGLNKMVGSLEEIARHAESPHSTKLICEELGGVLDLTAELMMDVLNESKEA